MDIDIRVEPELINRIGWALYGRHWIPQLSVALHLTDSEVRQWARGRPIPATIWPELLVLLRCRNRDLTGAMRAIEKHRNRLLEDDEL